MRLDYLSIRHRDRGQRLIPHGYAAAAELHGGAVAAKRLQKTMATITLGIKQSRLLVSIVLWNAHGFL
jgi:hypothetical protein